MKVEKIVSGGQTGVDRAALDFAIEYGIPHGGWVPYGRLSEDGCVPDRYKMQEHPMQGYPPRTGANVRDSDATIIFVNGPLNSERGALLTVTLCREMGKPFTVLNLEHITVDEGARALRLLLESSGATILNVAGTRGSHRPDTAKVQKVLEAVLANG